MAPYKPQKSDARNPFWGLRQSVRRVSLERLRRTRSATPLFHIRGRLAGHRIASHAPGDRVGPGYARACGCGGDPPLNITITAAILLVAGFLLILGLWTPIVGTSVAVIEVWKILTVPGELWLWVLLGTVSGALAMLGPGRWSIDARLFGWKRVEASPRERSSIPR